MAFAALEAPEHAAPTTPHTPASTKVCAADAPVDVVSYPLHPESAKTTSNWTLLLYPIALASCADSPAAAWNDGQSSPIAGLVASPMNPIFTVTPANGVAATPFTASQVCMQFT